MASLSTRLGKCLLMTSLVAAPFFAGGEVIFEENFDDQPDWHSAMHSDDGTQRASSHVIPEGWHSIRQDPTWAPSEGHPDRHESIEILGRNASKARGGTGKSMVSWRDSHNPGWNRWNSESMMVQYFPNGYKELYVEFWIRFDENWTRDHVSGLPSATSKLFRISSWSGEGSEYTAFGGGELGPIALWDYSLNSYGIRNRLSFRGGPHGENYGFKTDDIAGLPRNLVGSGDLSMNYTADLRGFGEEGADPVIQDRLMGGLIDAASTSTIHHDQVFGPGDSWSKLAFYVRMNSSPGSSDGVFTQWLNDKKIFHLTSIPWIRESGEGVSFEDVRWNLVAFGGNDFFQIFPNDERHEEWYSIDDIVIRSTIPDHLGLSEDTIAPSAPYNILVR